MPKNKEIGDLLVARFGAAHGIKGHVKVMCFVENPKDLESYGPLFTKDHSRSFSPKFMHELKGKMAVFSFKEITDRTQAEQVKNIELYCSKEQMPDLPNNEYYIHDLIGLKVIDHHTGQVIGTVQDVNNFGASDVIDILLKNEESLMMPFIEEFVVSVDQGKGEVVIDFPEEERMIFAEFLSE